MNPDKHHFFDLLYLGFLGHIKNRGRVEKDLKELKKMLDETADKMMEIVDKSEGQDQGQVGPRPANASRPSST